jgi:hypothetical protein
MLARRQNDSETQFLDSFCKKFLRLLTVTFVRLPRFEPRLPPGAIGS